jgi:hypothetical protein
MWIIIAWQHISPVMKGFKKCCISTEMAENYDDILQNDSEEDANVRVSVRRKRALSVKMETMTLIVTGR